MSNKYIHTIMNKGSANDALTAHRNLALAQGRGGDAIMLEHAKGMKLQGLPKGFPDNWDQMTPEEQKAWKKENMGCFTANTLISTPTGEKTIISMKKGDKVISFANGKTTVETVKSRIVYPSQTVWDFELSNGKTVSATNHHTMLTDSGWKKFGDIIVGKDKLICSDGKSAIVIHKKNPRMELVYNLTTTGCHNFIANGLVAHNYTFARKFRSVLHTILEKFENFEIPSYKTPEVMF